MTVRVVCSCGQAFAAKDHLIGQQVSCPKCGGKVIVGAEATFPVVPEFPIERRELDAVHVSRVPNDDHSSFTLSDDAQASNPGQVSLNPAKWFISYPKWPLIWGLPMIFLFALGFIHWSFWILFSVMLVAV